MFFYLLFLLLSIGQLGRISFLKGEINFYLYEILLALYFIILFFRYKLRPIEKSFKNLQWLYIFFILIYVSYFIPIFKYSYFQNLTAFLYLLRLTLYFSFFLYISYDFSTKKKDIKILEKSFLTFAILTVTISFIQYFLYPDLRNLFYLGWDPHMYRAFGVFFDTSTSASLYGLIILFFILKFRKIQLKKKYKTAFLTFYIVLSLLTYSRGFYISFLITFFIFLIEKRLIKYIFIIFIIFITVIIVILPRPFGEGVNLKRTFSIQARIDDYKRGVKIFRKSPLLGIGYNRLRYEKQRSSVVESSSFQNHASMSFQSSFLIILTTAGILGLISFIATLFQIATISTVSKYYVLFLSLFSLTDNILLQPFVLFLFLMLLLMEAKTILFQR